MSCNGCRVLRKGCSDTCVLRPCLQWIESPEAQGHATVFVAKFFGRAGLMSFISNVPENQRPALFQSLLYEAAGRTVNPVNGAVGLLWTGNWQVCQAAVDTVLRGGALKPIPDLLGGASSPETDDGVSECTNGSGVLLLMKQQQFMHDDDDVDPYNINNKRRRFVTDDNDMKIHNRHPIITRAAKNITQLADLNLSLTPRGKKSTSPDNLSTDDDEKIISRRSVVLGSPSMNSDQESVTTTSCTAGGDNHFQQQPHHLHEMKLLSLFN